MKWASAVSDQDNLEGAIEKCVSSIRKRMGEDIPNLVVSFVSSDFSSKYDQIPVMIQNMLGMWDRGDQTLLFGCSAGGVIGGGREVEQRPGVSLTLAHLPDVTLVPFHIAGDELPDMDCGPEVWESALNVSAADDPKFLLIADPFSFPAQDFLMGIDYAFSRSVKIGGLASGGHSRGDNALFLGDKVYRSGAIGIAMQGNIVVDTIVAQGCRPIGPVMCITKSKQNLLEELEEKPPLGVLRELYDVSSERDRELMQTSLFLGIVMDDFNDDPQHGDFLVRNVIGMDGRTGAMAIGETLREGQHVQFHVRDALTSSDDLSALLVKYAGENDVAQNQGALLFSCLGRGQYLYGRPDHDTNMFQEKVGDVPLGGFFCNGEIGPVGGTTFLHGYTSSFGIFRPFQES